MFESIWLNDEIGKTVYADESGSKDQYLCMRKVTVIIYIIQSVSTE